MYYIKPESWRDRTMHTSTSDEVMKQRKLRKKGKKKRETFDGSIFLAVET